MFNDYVLAIAGALLLAGAFSSKISSRFNLPALLLFLAAGIAAESVLPIDGKSRSTEINFFGVIAMAFILYSGGLETSLKSVKKVMVRGLMLAGPGVVLTALITGAGGYLIFDGRHSFLWSLLLGSLIASTDAAAVFAILRGQRVGLQGNLQPLLEFESGSNDPMAAFLTLTLIPLLTSGDRGNGVLALLQVIYQLGGGVLAGMAFGWAGKHLFRVKFDYEGLYFVISVSLVLLCYGATQLLGANGFMACYVCGIVMNGVYYNYKKSFTKFHNGVAWLMQVGLFIVLGFLADRNMLMDQNIWSTGILLGLVLIFIARPAAVFICLAFSEYSFKEKLMVSWVGIRGAAPIVLATFPLAFGVKNAEIIFSTIFFMVILSVVFQGWLLLPVAKMLKLTGNASAQRSRSPLELEITQDSAHQEMLEFDVTENSPLAGRTLADISLPDNLLVTMIRRGNTFIAPRGNTKIEPGDGVMIIAERKEIAEIEKRYFH